MRIIATILLLAITVQMPMSFSAAADEVKSQSVSKQTVFAEVTYSEETSVIKQEPVAYTEPDTAEKTETVEAVEEEEEIVYKEIVKADPIDTSKPYLQSASGTVSTSSTPVNYPLTDYERDLIERVVMTEIGGGTYEDKLAVAQCIYDRVIHYGKSVEQVIYQKNAFADPSTKTPSKSVKDAVEDVFTNGKRVTVEPIFYFIASYAVTSSCFHETQKCVLITDAQRYYTSR